MKKFGIKKKIQMPLVGDAHSGQALIIVLVCLSLLTACTASEPGRPKAEATDVVGTIGATAIRVPLQDVLLYEPDPGTRELKGRCERPLRSLVLRLRWPGLEPLNEKNAEDYHRGRQSIGDSQWLEIGMTRLADAETMSLSRLRDFDLYRKRIGSEYPFGLLIEQGRATEIGLQFAHLRQPLPHTTNLIVYADQMDIGQEPSTLIVCGYRPQPYAPPHRTSLCNQAVIAPMLPRVKVRISYRTNLLREWPQITSAVHAYLGRMQADCPTQTEVKETKHG